MARLTLAAQGIVDPVYSDYAQRIVYIDRMFGDFFDGVEIGFFAHETEEMDNALSRIKNEGGLRPGGENSLHVAHRLGASLPDGWLETVMYRAGELYDEGLITFMGFHLDMIDIFDEVTRLAPPGLTLAWELLGADAQSGNRCADAETAVAGYPEWKAILDVAHIGEMERNGEPGVKVYFDRFQDNLKQVHFSYPGNLYPASLMGEGFTTKHSLVSLNEEYMDCYFGMLQSLHNVTVTIEGVAPPGPEGERMLRREATLAREWIATGTGREKGAMQG